MNIYELKLDEGKINDITHYVLAKDFEDAVAQAEKLLAQVRLSWESTADPPECEIVRVEKLFVLEVVK